jgi:hypothetical protein
MWNYPIANEFTVGIGNAFQEIRDSFNQQTWNLMVAVVNGTNVTQYVNGTWVGTFNRNNLEFGDRLDIGRRKWPGDPV